MNILDFKKYKESNRKISIITCYDYWSAKIISETDIDVVLVGDSVAMTIHGHKITIPATVDMMATHTKAVVKGAPNKFIVADLPFCSYRKGFEKTIDAVESLMKAGASCVKLEGAGGNLNQIRHIVGSGVPVLGHIGLTPQSFHQMGGYRVQGRGEDGANQLMKDAHALQDAGCFSIVLECVPADLAERITEDLDIPIIGIGAGVNVDGQVLVLQDMLGVFPDIAPKFAKKYLDGFSLIKGAIQNYVDDVNQSQFPGEEHSF